MSWLHRQILILLQSAGILVKQALAIKECFVLSTVEIFLHFQELWQEFRHLQTAGSQTSTSHFLHSAPGVTPEFRHLQTAGSQTSTSHFLHSAPGVTPEFRYLQTAGSQTSTSHFLHSAPGVTPEFRYLLTTD